ncbi:MAG TPA: hypothetical protein ENI85_10560 [Deltaproteobacteria bacterium]|nr:hypothetical protein [Deltaproteobacteria bacterium]
MSKYKTLQHTEWEYGYHAIFIPKTVSVKARAREVSRTSSKPKDEKRDKVTCASCWAHVRRKFVEAEDVEPERVARVLDWIRGFYRIEDEIREEKLEGEAKLERRTRQSKPLVTELFAWLEQDLVASALVPTNPFTNAARHALKLKPYLEVFLSDPEVPIDTNHLERALRPIPSPALANSISG